MRLLIGILSAQEFSSHDFNQTAAQHKNNCGATAASHRLSLFLVHELAQQTE
jgi:hypothetical protein